MLKVMKNPITVTDVITASGKYPEREHSPELTLEVIENINILIGKVNSLLAELDIDSVKISSGFRPSAVNSKIANAAKRSAHMIGKAIDLEDSNKILTKIVDTDKGDALLKKYGLMIENPEKTSTWLHIDMVQRSPRSRQKFDP